MKNIILTGLALPILFGCSLMDKKAEVAEEVVSQPPKVAHPLEQDATMAYRNKERAGAAYNMEAYVHVLGQRESSPVEVDLPEKRNLPQSAAEVLDAVNQIDGKDKLRSYSLYEMSRWQRFCDAGKGMDQRDWLFVVGEGGSEAVPASLDNCQLPTFSYQDYLSAWAKHCSGDAITNSEVEILRKTEIAKKVCKDNLPSS